MRLALLGLCLCLGACMSVPLSTMARMSSFGEKDFVQLDADVVRVKVTLPEGFRLDVSKSWLGTDIASATGAHQAVFQLEQEAAQSSSIPGGLFSGPRPALTHVLRLSQPSRSSFRDLQAFVRANRAEQITLRVVPVLASSPPDARVATVWIDLLLSQPQGYFTLLDGAKIEVAKLRGKAS